jgi:uncharacterized protein YbjT (DUF2867 family)
MKVFVAGAGGLIGARLVDALLAAGHRVRVAGRDAHALRQRWPACSAVAVDYARDHAPETWAARVRGCDAVVNAVGIFLESGMQTFESVHVRAPAALFAACIATRVARVVQVSALGATADAPGEFLQSKSRADEALLSLPLTATVLRPSLVYGTHGASTRAFLALAALPRTPLPDGGRQRVQPVDLDDLTGAILRLIEMPSPPRVVDAVGPRCLTLRDYIAVLRSGMGLRPARTLALPPGAGAALRRLLPRQLAPFADAGAMRLLARDNCAASGPMRALLGRKLRDPRMFVRSESVVHLRRAARQVWLLPALRISIGVVWLASAAMSFGFFPRAQSLALLVDVGVPPSIALPALYAAASLDLVLGLLVLFAPRGRRGYGVQVLLILAYTLVISVRLPAFWLHPFGPVLKNLPMLVALGLLAADEERWST